MELSRLCFSGDFLGELGIDPKYLKKRGTIKFRKAGTVAEYEPYVFGTKQTFESINAFDTSDLNTQRKFLEHVQAAIMLSHGDYMLIKSMDFSTSDYSVNGVFYEYTNWPKIKVTHINENGNSK